MDCHGVSKKFRHGRHIERPQTAPRFRSVPYFVSEISFTFDFNCCSFPAILLNLRYFALPEPASAKLATMAREYNTLTVALQSHFRGKGLCLFQTGTYKSHWLYHSFLESNSISPRQVWCYSGEDFMSKMKVLMHHCLICRSALSSLRFFLQRYMY